MKHITHDDRKFIVHPSYIILFLVIAGITSLFLGFSGAYLFNRLDQDILPVHLPNLFYWNTMILISSSISLIWAKRFYHSDQYFYFISSLIITLVLTIFFLISQIFAWDQLQSNEIFVAYNNMASYLYVISGIHFVHVVGGIPFLIYFLIMAIKKMKTPEGELIYFSDRINLRRLELISIYWHFLDGLWIYLVLFFMLNFILQ